MSKAVLTSAEDSLSNRYYSRQCLRAEQKKWPSSLEGSPRSMYWRENRTTISCSSHPYALTAASVAFPALHDSGCKRGLNSQVSNNDRAIAPHDRCGARGHSFILGKTSQSRKPVLEAERLARRTNKSSTISALIGSIAGVLVPVFFMLFVPRS